MNIIHPGQLVALSFEHHKEYNTSLKSFPITAEELDTMINFSNSSLLENFKGLSLEQLENKLKEEAIKLFGITLTLYEEE